MNNKLYKTLRVAIPLLLMTLLTFYCSSGGGASKTFDYICTNGTKADGTTSTANTEKCSACNTSYKLNDNEICVGAFDYICTNGTKDKGRAPAANTEKCTACNTSYELTSEECVLPSDGVFLWVTKVRYNGNLMGDGGVTGAPTGATGQLGADAKCAHADNVPAYLKSLTNHKFIHILEDIPVGNRYSHSLASTEELKPTYQSVAGGTDMAITLSLGEQLVTSFNKLFETTSPVTSPRSSSSTGGSGILKNRSKPYVKNMVGSALTLTYWSGASGNLGDDNLGDIFVSCNAWTTTNNISTGNIGNAGWEQTVGGVDLTENYWLDLIDVWRETGGSGDQVHRNIKSNCVTGQQRLLCASYNTP